MDFEHSPQLSALVLKKINIHTFSDCLSLKSKVYGAVPDFLTLYNNVWSTSGSEPGEEIYPKLCLLQM